MIFGPLEIIPFNNAIYYLFTMHQTIHECLLNNFIYTNLYRNKLKQNCKWYALFH